MDGSGRLRYAGQLNGIVNQENMDLDALAADKAYRFMYVYSPVPIAGATGSIGAPLAIR